MELAAGTRLGPYEILGPLGAGGMGEVFRARDTRLGREVAIKVLPGAWATDSVRLRRFEQEARAASALNHPNILTIFDVGGRDGAPYLVTELLQGETLRERLATGPLPETALLDVAIQIAGALASAHKAGILHRDLKPGNLFLTRDGHAKVLDFGLAKITALDPLESGASLNKLASDPEELTSPGVPVGTAAYMSPEQMLGRPLDARSDIFSLGCVLYEMATARRAFPGATAAAISDSILHRTPVPPSRLAAVPAELERIISRALEKDPELRYQHASDLNADLKRLRRDAARPPAADPTTAMAPWSPPSSGARESSDSHVLAGLLQRHRAPALAAGAALVVVLAAAAYGMVQLARRPTARAPAAQFQTMQLAPLTTSGTVTEAALSPDGRFVVYVAAEGEGFALWLRQTDTDSQVRIVPPAPGSYRGVTFSPDGRSIVFSRFAAAQGVWVLYRVPILGGTPQELVADVDSPVSFSPDGSQFAFVRLRPNLTSLFRARADGAELTQLASTQPPERLNRSGPAWAASGAAIAVSSQILDGTPGWRLLQAPIHGGEFTRLTMPANAPWLAVGQIAWLPHDTRLLVVAESGQRSTQPLGQIWELSEPSGEVRRITNDLNSYDGISLARDGASFVTVQTQESASLETGSGNDPGRLRAISSSSGNNDGRFGLDWSGDGRLVYSSEQGGQLQIWAMGADGAGGQQLTASAPSGWPRVAPGGKEILFASARNGSYDIWAMDMDGSHQRQLTHGGSTTDFDVSPDGKWLLYTAIVQGVNVLFKMPLAGGTRQRVATLSALDLPIAISPDGKWVAFPSWTGAVRLTNVDYELLPLSGGQPVALKSATPEAGTDLVQGIPMLRWSPDGRALVIRHEENGASNLWMLPIDGGAPRPLTHFTSQLIYGFAYSRDGQRLALSRGTRTSNAILIQNY